jgi:hypothetical protein
MVVTNIASRNGHRPVSPPTAPGVHRAHQPHPQQFAKGTIGVVQLCQKDNQGNGKDENGRKSHQPGNQSDWSFGHGVIKLVMQTFAPGYLPQGYPPINVS